LTIVTDEGAANGAAGKTVSFTLAGTAATTSFYWKGGHGGAWNSTSSGFNWTIANGSSTEVSTLPSTDSDIFFTDPNPGTTSTTLGQNFSVKSVTFSASSAPMAIGGSNTLTIVNGLTVSGGTASHSIGAPVQLGASQMWTINGSGMLLVNGAISGSGALTKSGSGLLQISGSNTFSGGTNVTAGTLQLAAGSALPQGMSVSIAGSGSAIVMNSGLPTAVNIGGLSIDGGAASPQAVFDLGNGKLIVDKTATSLATIRSEIIAGRAGGTWNGHGITSGAAASDVVAGGGTSNTALGYADNSDFGMGLTAFGGQTVNSNSLLLRYTVLGDANLDGKVDLSDFLSLRHNFGLTSNATWDQSDFNFDGKVDLSDFLILRAHFGQSLPSAIIDPGTQGATAAKSVLATVPEPATTSLTAACLFGIAAGIGLAALRRSRRRPRVANVLGPDQFGNTTP
jgi:autotransporter-associated beta strand protein